MALLFVQQAHAKGGGEPDKKIPLVEVTDKKAKPLFVQIVPNSGADVASALRVSVANPTTKVDVSGDIYTHDHSRWQYAIKRGTIETIVEDLTLEGAGHHHQWDMVLVIPDGADGEGKPLFKAVLKVNANGQ